MSNTMYDTLRNVKKGRTDWRVKVRIIREWRGYTITGEPFKGYNLLLLDSKNCRMQAFVPSTMEDRLGKVIQLGNLYKIKTFHVKEYGPQDKYRPVQIERQIIFTTDTKLKEIDENEIFIPKNMFDLFKFADLKNMATQQVYLADVIGIIPKKEKLNNFTNSFGKQQVNIKFKLSDDKSRINVTFRDAFAENFWHAMSEDLEEPLILIIASAKISSWRDQIDVCNYSPTKFYLNYDHHRMQQLRKMLKEPDFTKHKFSTRRKKFKTCTVDEIKKMGVEGIEEEVICKANVKYVDETSNWNYGVCTSCNNVFEIEEGNNICKKCPRTVPHPNRKFNISVVASDATGEIQVLIKDREIRSLLGIDFESIEEKDKNFPKLLKTIQGKDYTFKLRIKEDNINGIDKVYDAIDIFLGFESDVEMVEEQETFTDKEPMTGEPSGSSYHIDQISQFNNM
ncbi:hypothetical protein POM88_022960 [Heracleum sosnowskyi]|uniref:Replication factor A C-terminal domain-containing protein n=1 Tax=Heracleum sosnowskyi TaxID=360622 RepID=A0AAD8IJS3_9APIA|nr:hypothetical protein POM88_022960 [Heracleum sosnowskyi]